MHLGEDGPIFEYEESDGAINDEIIHTKGREPSLQSRIVAWKQKIVGAEEELEVSHGPMYMGEDDSSFELDDSDDNETTQEKKNDQSDSEKMI
ncbi:hypothetical protein ACLOJK_018581 [Asimina triloba]